MKKEIWSEKLGRYKEVNLSANRICVYYIRKNIGTRKFTLTDLQQALQIDRKTAWNWLSSLKRSGYVKSKTYKKGKKLQLDNRIYLPNKKGRKLDNRWYQLSKKGRIRLPRRKDIKKIEYIEREVLVPIETEVEVEKSRTIMPVEEV